MTTTSHAAKTFKLIRLFLAGLLLITWAGQPGALYSAPAATTWYVGTGSDLNPCTSPAHPCEHIQAAIDKAASGDTIIIAAKVYLEQLSIADKNLTLIGQGAANTILDGNQADTVLDIIRSSVPSVTVNVSGVTLRNGLAGQPGGGVAIEAFCSLTLSNSVIANNTTTSSGGGISNQGTLKLINVTISANSATGSLAEGGGIYNTGNLELSGVVLTANHALNGAGISNRNTLTVTGSSITSNTGSTYGGGIYNVTVDSKLILLNSILSGNAAFAGPGGAIYNRGILVSTYTTILGNNAAHEGGGIYNDTSGQVTLTGSSLRSNTAGFAGGGLFNTGIAQINAAVITGNNTSSSGGGIHNDTNGNLTLATSNVSSNTASGGPGGGINNMGALTLIQSALVYNAATSSQGGGLGNAGNAQLTNVTVSDNTALSGGGIQNSGGTLSLQFDTVSNNSAPSLNNASGSVTAGNSIFDQITGNACGGTISSAGYNIDRGTSCGLHSTGDLASTNPFLGPLQDNGGNSPTRALAVSSTGVDSATSACPPPSTDQRGIVRQAGICDRGAYELVGYSNPNALDIGPNQCVVSTFTVSDKLYIGRLQVGVNLTYPNRHDLTIRLFSPVSSQVGLLGPAGNVGQNLDTLFDDSAPTIVPTGDQNPSVPYYENFYKPSTPLAQMRGINIKGTWSLQICNSNPAITASGTLNRWVLVVPETASLSKIYFPLIKR